MARTYVPKLNIYPSQLGNTRSEREVALSALRSIMDRLGGMRFKKPKDANVFGKNRVQLAFPSVTRAHRVKDAFDVLTGQRLSRAIKRVYI